MDYTPPSPAGTPSSAADSGCASMGATPGPADQSTPLRARKRRAPGDAVWLRRLADVVEACPECPGTPQFSSTLNESLMKNLEEIRLEAGGAWTPKGPDPKRAQARSAPATPEKQIRLSDGARKPSSGFVRSFAAAQIDSPLKQSHDILYPTLRPHEPRRPVVAPSKAKGGTPAKKRLFAGQRRDPFPRVVSNGLVMAKILGYLSGGDLYRVSMVCGGLRRAVREDGDAFNRYLTFVERHKKNKENYMITPPSSPEKEEEPTGGDSPRTRRFKEYFEVKKELNKNQTLTKCPACNKPAIVDNCIAQCRNAFCGHIHCRRCDSFANRPEDFVDRCGNAMLLDVSTQGRRRTLDDLSNSTIDLSDHSFFTSSRYDSGIGSEQDSTNTPERVKRNLSGSFGGGERPKALFDSNRVARTREKQTRRQSSILPVVAREERKVEVAEPPSPPRVKLYAACSKQSKRNLKRLTR